MNLESTFNLREWKVPPIQCRKPSENEISRRFNRILQRWVSFAKDEFAEWPNRANSGYFFGGDFWYSSETASTALVFAALTRFGEYDEQLTGLTRDKAKDMAIKSIRYMGFTHDTGPSDCVRVKGSNKYTSGKKWGGKGDNFFMASQNGRSISVFAMAAWILWDDLDKETKELVKNVVTNYADQFCAMEPRNGSYYDTQCEENAWTSAGIGAAMILFPEHPHNTRWRKGFENWSINTVTTYWDRLTARSGLIDGLAHNDIKTINFHPDYTTENHAFVHPSYLCAGINLRAIHAVFSLMCGQEILPSALYNNRILYEKTVKVWAQSDGLAVPIQGQDWWYNRHHERQLTHAVLNVIHQDKEAARLELECLKIIEDIQNSNEKGCLLEEDDHIFNTVHSQSSKTFEPGSALDLVHSYLLHLFGGQGADPVSNTSFKKQQAGVHTYPHGCFVIHRTEDTFTSFSWRNNVMFLALPSDGLWNITPLFNSYTGVIKVKNKDDSKGITNEFVIRKTEKCTLHEYENGFAAVAIAYRGANGEVEQKFAVVSLPNGQSVYMEQIVFKEKCELEEALTGIIGIRNENYRAMKALAPGQRTLYLPHEQETFKGFIGLEPNSEKSWNPLDYVNVDNKIGYLLNGTHGITYKNLHQYEKWKGIENLLILNNINRRNFSKDETLPMLSLFSMPNQSAEETKEEAKSIFYLDCEQSGVQVLTKREYLVYANLQGCSAEVTACHELRGDRLYLFEGTTIIKEGSYHWKKEIAANNSGFFESPWLISCDQWSDAEFHLEVQIEGKRLVLLNRTNKKLLITLIDRESQKHIVKEIQSSSFLIME